MSPDPTVLNRIEALLTGQRRFIALVGAPGSGKSTYAEALCDALNAGGRANASILAMDGYHLDNAILDAREWRTRKGAPHTFDVGALARDLARLRDTRDSIFVPVFDRGLDLARAAATEITPACNLVIVEGNYLLLDDAPWRDLCHHFDLSIFLDVPEPVLEARLLRRWHDHGLGDDEAHSKVSENDMPNARLIRQHSRPADIVLANWESSTTG
jgi:pantothenate kinase